MALLPALPLLSFPSLPSLPTIPVPEVTVIGWVMIFVALTIPMAAYLVIQLSRVIQWMDVVVMIGLMLVPAVVIIGVKGFLPAAAVTGILGFMMAHALGIIDAD